MEELLVSGVLAHGDRALDAVLLALMAHHGLNQMSRNHFLQSGRLRGIALVCRGLVGGRWIDLALGGGYALIGTRLLLAVHLLLGGGSDPILSVAVEVAAKALLVGAALRVHTVRADVAVVRNHLLVFRIASLSSIRFSDLVDNFSGRIGLTLR